MWSSAAMASADITGDVLIQHDNNAAKKLPEDDQMVNLQPDDDFDWEAYM